MKILVTGSAGFIGFHLSNCLIKNEFEVIGLDIINDYYDVNLKFSRLKELGIESNKISYNQLLSSSKYSNFSFIKLKLEDQENLFALFLNQHFDLVCNLAAQAGVRYSLTNPYAYLNSNIHGFLNILEACRNYPVNHLVYASSSSVYGLNSHIPFSTHDNVDHPISLYAASKKSNELMAHTYSYLYNIPSTGLRFFTVYGPWGRPDMALFLFTKAILEKKPIDIFNNGLMQRDFTYVDDIVEGIYRVINHPPSGNPQYDVGKNDPSRSVAPYKIYNIGNNNPVKLLDFVETIEFELGLKSEKKYLPLQPGDVQETWADVSDLVEDLGYRPGTGIKKGIKEFISWYKSYYCID